MACTSLLVPALMSAICLGGAQVSYLLFHALAELFSIVVALAALAVSTTSLRFTRNHFVVYIAVAAGWAGSIDLLHLLVFKGMHLLPTNSANPATQLWIAARSLQALALVTAPLLLLRSVRLRWLHAGFGSVAVLAMLLVGSGHFPDAYIDGQGLTPFKIYAEYAIIGLLACALLLFWHQRTLMSERLRVHLMAALVFMILSEFAFTRYVSVYATSNMVGHLLKIFAYWYVYQALVQNTLREPFGMLARAASIYDAVPEPTLIVTADGTIRQANRAAALYAAQPAEQLIGQSIHGLFHDANVPAHDCPVCAGIAGADEAPFTVELECNQNRSVFECSVAPFHFQGDGRAYVQVVRDITERRRMRTEREALVYDLGERVKELRCLHSIAQLVETTGLQLPALLQGVAALMPPAFAFPEQVQVAVVSSWGRFGQSAPPSAPALLLERSICVHGQPLGQLQAWYVQQPSAKDTDFLPEEAHLLDSVVQQIGNAIEGMQAQEKIYRLSNLYEMLSATNHAVVHCKDQESLLAALYEALIAHGTFPIIFIALADSGAVPLRIHRTYGLEPQHVPLLAQALQDPGSGFCQLIPDFMNGQIAVDDVSTPAQGTAGTPWVDFLNAQKIAQRAVLPLVREGQLLGVFGLYARGLVTFDADELRLLSEMASDLSFALNHLAHEERLASAREQVQRSEHRFSQVFHASPLPMQIYALSTRQVRAINKAFQDWLGYTAEDVATVDAWFECFFREEYLRSQIRAHWEADVPQSIAGETTHSPELELTCKNGSVRTARGRMTVVGDDAIIAWTDLTEIRQSEKILRDSEQRFRNMIEQTISGVYVRRNGRFIYVNPRFCEITGWSSDEMLGHDVLLFTTPDSDNLARIQRAWARLEAGERNVAYTIPLRRKDGKVIEMGLNATQITWDDGQSATIVMAQDISERKRTEDQISNYIHQLEASRKSTLQALSNMVELRDPYTAGHERRVGLIAGAIACEMGWDESRCEDLELVGLVHDIGKIAVPSEILTKPSRLSTLEMELVKCHAQAGYDIIKDVYFVSPVAEIIRQHHERMDGSGYPRGLKGEEILPEARVVAVADVIESMASHRPYRPALGIELALAEIVRGRGSFYDPEVVDAVVRLIEEKHYTLPK